MNNRFYRFLGRFFWRAGLPIISQVLRRTSRVYIFIIYKDEVLLVKNWFGEQQWQLPGGGRRRGESADTAIRREVHEELRIELPDQLHKITAGRWTQIGYKYEIMSCRLSSKETLQPASQEIIAAKWLPLDKLKELPGRSDFLKAAAGALPVL